MVIDILFLVIAAYGFYSGYSKGIIKTVFGIIAILIGFMVAVRFSPFVVSGLESIFNNSGPIIYLGGFFLTFLLTMLIIRTIAKALEKVLKNLNINFINKSLGGLILSALFVLAYSVLLWFGDRAGIVTDNAKSQSMTYEYLETFPGHIKTFIKKLEPTVKDIRDKSVETLDKLEEKAKEKDSGEANE